MILDQTISIALNQALKGLPSEAIVYSPNGAPDWQNELVSRVINADPGKRMEVYKQAISGHANKVSIEAEVFTADRKLDLDNVPLTDTGNAELFAEFFGDRVRYDHRRSRWLIWQQHRWQPDTDGEINRLGIEAIRRRMELATHISDQAKRKEALKWALSSESRYKMDAMTKIASNLRPISDSGDSWDSDPWLLGCSNGVVDLRSGKLRPGYQLDRITMTTGIDYDPSARAPRWERFLDEVFDGDQNMVQFVQRALGYSLTGDVREQCLFLCWGGGANGKSTMLSTVRKALGDYSRNTSFSTFELNNRNSNTNDMAGLAGSRLVTASETSDATRLNEARVKAVTGGDPVTARYLFSEFFTYTPTYKVFLAMNHLPIIYGTDTGIWRRIRLIPFNVSFLGREDKTLDSVLASELPGILVWILEGVKAWQDIGLNPPETVTAATNSYRMDSDMVQQFLDAETVMDAAAKVKAGELFKKYKDWCQANYSDPMTQNAFGRRMREHGIQKERVSGFPYYLGLGLLIDEGLFKDKYGLKDN